MKPKIEIQFCHGPQCSQRPAMKDALSEAEKQLNIYEGQTTGDGILLGRCGCQGQCEKGPNIRIDRQESDEAEVINEVRPHMIGKMIRDIQS